MFSKVGKVMDVFIPLKGRRMTKTRFGFVRFKTLDEARAAIVRWNGDQVGNRLLKVMLADEGGKPVFQQKNFSCEKRVPRMETQFEAFEPKAWRPKRPLENLSFQEGDKRDCSKHLSAERISLKVVPENVEWLKFCVVGSLREFVPVEQMKKELRNNNIFFHKVFPMAGHKMVINFSNQEEMDNFLAKNSPMVSQRFSQIQKWSEDEQPKTRSIWLSVTGLPFKAWSEENYAIIAKSFGTYLGMDERTKQFTGLDRARFMVETSQIGKLSKVIEADIDGKVFELGVFEDCFLSGCETQGLLICESDENPEQNRSSSSSCHETTSRRISQACQMLSNSKEVVPNSAGINATPPEEELGGEENLGPVRATGRIGFSKSVSYVSKAMSETQIQDKKVPDFPAVVSKGRDVSLIAHTQLKKKSLSPVKVVDSSEAHWGENMSEGDSFFSMEKLQNRLKAMKRKASKGKGVVKYTRRMKSEATVADKKIQRRGRRHRLETVSHSKSAEKEVIEEPSDAITERDIEDATKTLELSERLGVKFIGKKEDILREIIKVSRR